MIGTNMDPIVLGSSAIKSYDKYQIQKIMIKEETYRLLPTPITRHEILEAMDALSTILLYWHVIKFILEVRIRENVVNEESRVMEPDFVFCSHS
jgi:hypothetical protein